MAPQAKIVLVTANASERDRLVYGLAAESAAIATVEPATGVAAGPPDADLVLIDASAADLIDTVRRCRQRWPHPSTSLLVVNASDDDATAAAIDAGANDSLPDAAGNLTLLRAHVRRLLKTGRIMRTIMESEVQNVRRQSLARAAADVAAPLGDVVDGLEAIMVGGRPDKRMNELLDRVGRAVDAVERLRRQATQRTDITD